MFRRSIPLKTRNSQFYLIFTASHQVQYLKIYYTDSQKSLTRLILDLKIHHLLHFGNKYTFSQNWAKLIKISLPI